MKIRVDLEYRKFEETPYDIVDKETGKRNSGISRFFTFINDDEKILKVKLSKDDTMPCVEMEKGKVYTVILDVVMKPVVGKDSGSVSERNFLASFTMDDVVPFVEKEVDNSLVEDKNKGVKK